VREYVRLTGIMFLLTHIMACGWNAVGRAQREQQGWQRVYFQV
jgi:hypothetical protein